MRHNPADSTYPVGYVYFTIYTQPGCGGTLVRGLTLCSQSTTSGVCQVPAVFDRMSDSLMRAMTEGLRVTVSDTYPLGSYAYSLELRAP